MAAQLGVSRGPIREAMRLLEHDGLLTILPNRGAVVPKPTMADVLGVYAMRSALGSLALHKLMLEGSEGSESALERERVRFEGAVERGKAPQAAEADLAYQATVVTSAGMPRVTRQFDQLTWQVWTFISTMGVSYDDMLPLMLSEVRALHKAIVGGEGAQAERLWREKFERWVRDFLGRVRPRLVGGIDHGSRSLGCQSEKRARA